MLSKRDELVEIIEKFAESDWDLIEIPSKSWLQKRNQDAMEKVEIELINAIETADKECGRCGCEYDDLYKRALILLKSGS